MPLWSVAAVVVISNIVFGAANTDPIATEVARIGPLRVTQEAIATATAVGARVIAIASVGVVFALTTEPTRLVDALVQQAHVSDRFAYGALAAYQAVPRFADDLTTLRQARRIRGLRRGVASAAPLGLLVLAIRHGDRVALAMDARGFGSGPRTHYRVVRWTWGDASRRSPACSCWAWRLPWLGRIRGMPQPGIVELLLVALRRHHPDRVDRRHRPPDPGAVPAGGPGHAVLKDRFASGDIDEAEYHRLRSVLQRG